METTACLFRERPDYRGGKNKRRANGEGIYKRVGEKRWCVYREGEKVNGVFEESAGLDLQLQNREVKS